MALYEITQDCRIANNEYQRGDIVSDSEVGGYYPSIMKLTNGQPKKAEKKEESLKSELTNEENVSAEKEDKKTTKKWKKK